MLINGETRKNLNMQEHAINADFSANLLYEELRDKIYQNAELNLLEPYVNYLF